LNTISDPYLLEDSESRELLNVVSTQRGSIRKRFGSVQFITGSIPNLELDTVYPCAISGTHYLIVAGATKVYVVDPAGAITEIGSGFTTKKPWSIVQAPKTTAVASEGPVYLVNGTDPPQFWNGKVEAASVKEWKGTASAVKTTDGTTTANGVTLKSKTAGFISTDIGLQITFNSTVEVSGGGTISEATIASVVNSEEVMLEGTIGFNEKGFKEAYSGVKFEIKRSFYAATEHVPNGKYMIFAGNRIWMTGIEADPSAVWFSELVSIGEGGAQADPSSWPTTNVVRFDSSDENPINGIGTVGPYLCVFKETKTWIIHDLNTGANRRIADTVGCVSHRSIVETTGGTFFLTTDQGVYLTEGSKLHEMSYNVRPTILGINPAQRQNAAGAYFNNHYYLSFAAGSSTSNNRTLDFDAQLKSWWLHDLAGPQWAIQEPTAGKETLFVLPAGTKKGIAEAFKEGIWTDLGANYTGNGVLGAFWVGPWEPFAYYIFRHRIKAPFLKKRCRQIFFNGEGQITPGVFKNFSIGERQEGAVVGNKEEATSRENPVNFNAASEKWGEGSGIWGTEVPNTEVIWGGETTIGQARIYAPGVAFVWAVGFGNNSAEPFVVNSAVFVMQFRKS
jgi:hypothetical protein